MNYLDILIIIPLIIGGWRGFKKGFIIEVFTLLALLVGIYAGIHFSDLMSNFLQNSVGLTSDYMPAISFTFTLLLVGAMVYFAGKLIEKAIKVVALGTINKLAGLFFGLVKVWFILSAAIVMLEAYDYQGQFIPKDLKSNSLLYEPVKNTSLKTIPAIEESELFERSFFNF
jgi:membrane protein required for colicin V production